MARNTVYLPTMLWKEDAMWGQYADKFSFYKAEIVKTTIGGEKIYVMVSGYDEAYDFPRAVLEMHQATYREQKQKGRVKVFICKGDGVQTDDEPSDNEEPSDDDAPKPGAGAQAEAEIDEYAFDVDAETKADQARAAAYKQSEKVRKAAAHKVRQAGIIKKREMVKKKREMAALERQRRRLSDASDASLARASPATARASPVMTHASPVAGRAPPATTRAPPARMMMMQ